MFACVSLYAPWACRSQQRTLEPPETGVVNNLVGTESWTYVLCESSKYSELLSNHLSRPLTVSESLAWSSSSGSGLPASSGDLPLSLCPALRWQAHNIIMLSFLHEFGALSSSSCICKASTFMMKLSLSSEYFLCVCMYCVHMRVIGNTCIWVCMYLVDQDWCWLSSFTALYFMQWDMVSQLNPELADVSCLAIFLQGPLSLHPMLWDSRWAAVCLAFTCVLEICSDPNVCMAHAFPTEPSPKFWLLYVV